MKRAGWLSVAEAGGSFGIYFFVVASTLFGRAVARLFLRPVAAYYSIVHRGARRASREWLERVHGPRRVTRGMVFAHLLRFAQVALDRLFLVRRQTWRFEIRIHGEEYFRTLRASKRGAIFLGAHLGSFEALRVLAEIQDVPVNIVAYFRNAGMINGALKRLDPDHTARLIEIRPGGIDFVFAVRECIERGEHVAILGDRVGLGEGTTEVWFMGATARLPTGVYRLAAALRCPIYLTFALYTEPNRYDIHCEPFAERVELPRHARAQAIQQYAQRYAERLEHYARRAPDNWFNFFDYWA